MVSVFVPEGLQKAGLKLAPAEFRESAAASCLMAAQAAEESKSLSLPCAEKTQDGAACPSPQNSEARLLREAQ